MVRSLHTKWDSVFDTLNCTLVQKAVTIVLEDGRCRIGPEAGAEKIIKSDTDSTGNGSTRIWRKWINCC